VPPFFPLPEAIFFSEDSLIRPPPIPLPQSKPPPTLSTDTALFEEMSLSLPFPSRFESAVGPPRPFSPLAFFRGTSPSEIPLDPNIDTLSLKPPLFPSKTLKAEGFGLRRVSPNLPSPSLLHQMLAVDPSALPCSNTP